MHGEHGGRHPGNLHSFVVYPRVRDSVTGCGSHRGEWSFTLSWCRLRVYPRVRGAVTWVVVWTGEVLPRGGES